MDSEDTPVVFSVGTSFLSETCGNTTIFDREVGLFDPFVSVHGRDWLFRSGNKVSVVAFFTGLVFFSSFDFVKIFFKIAQLTGFLHNFLFHEIWWLDQVITLLGQELDSEVDQSVVKKNTASLKEVTSVTGNLLSSFWVVASK